MHAYKFNSLVSNYNTCYQTVNIIGYRKAHIHCKPAPPKLIESIIISQRLNVIDVSIGKGYF